LILNQTLLAKIGPHPKSLSRGRGILNLVSFSYAGEGLGMRARIGIFRKTCQNTILKTKGYHLEHNFGHGQRHLSSTLLVLNLIAFLFHAVLQLVDEKYQLIRKKRGSRKGFFEDIRSLTKFFLFESWQALIDFMISGQLPAQNVNSS
jgi:hypothetical protein